MQEANFSQAVLNLGVNLKEEFRDLLEQITFLSVFCFRIYDWMPEQPNIFQTEQLERLKKELPELKSCICPTVSHFSTLGLCKCHSSHPIRARMGESTESF